MKRIMTVLLGVGLAAGSQAQKLKQNLSFGPTVGFGHSWLTVDGLSDNYDREFHPAYNVGIKLVYSIVPHWGISADIKFSGEGGRFETTSGSTTTELKYRTNYIRVPLQGVYFFGKYGDRVHPKISLGPSFGFLVGGKITTEVNDDEVGDGLDSKDYFKGFDIGLNGAVGLNIRIATATWLNTDLTYYHGLSNVNDVGGDMKNRNLGINVGVAFGIGTAVPHKQ